MRINLLAVPCICVVLGWTSGCRTLAPSSSGPPRFSGRLLIGVTPEQAQRVAQSRFARPEGATGAEWNFSSVPSLDKGGARGTAGRVWLLAAPSRGAAQTPKGNPWDMAHDALDEKTAGPVSALMPDLSRAAGGSVVSAVVEPDLYFEQPRLSKALGGTGGPATGRGERSEGTVGKQPSRHWPRGRALDWYMSDEYSQLRSAMTYARQKRAAGPSERRIKIALIDTGYNQMHVSAPPGLNKLESRDFTENPMRPVAGAEDPYNSGPLNMPGHGTACLGMLAGNRVKFSDYGFDNYLGAAADFEIVVYRVSDSVVHFFPSTLAVAIKYAVAQGCDVISLSHGGLPSQMLEQAINEAYENGTAIFAASGDFVEIPLLRWTTTETVVYPAAFDRVVAVCGATADRRSYGRSPGLFSLLLHRDLKNWMLRGNYGPDALMIEAIAGYTPNVVWAQYGRDYPDNVFNLDGFGTSASTPQVASAAALWLDVHKDDPALASKWRSWEKAEAVYLALFDSAQKNTPEGGESFKYFGNGLLKARDAMNLGVPRYMDKRPPATVGLGWIRALAGMLPGVRAVPGAAESASAAAHAEMVQTELAQLVCSSSKLRRMEAGLEFLAGHTAAPQDSPELRAFLAAAKKEKNASRYLKCALGDIERHLSRQPQ